VNSIPTFAASEKTDVKKLAPLMDATAKCGPEVTSGDFKACDRFDVMDKLSEITAPVLVLAGEDDKMTPLKYSQHMKENIKRASMVKIKEAGHLLPMERPETFNRAVVDFLKREMLI
jgi:pimeloyl-ACP methyl ester carboxylesterase